MGVLLDLGNDTVQVEYSASVYYPARISGPPENCCPAEGGEVEILAVEYETKGKAFIDGKWQRVDRVIVDVMPLLPDSEIERFQEEIANIEEDDEP
jgi:hypothetical protein